MSSSESESVTIWPGTSPMTRAVPPSHGISEVVRSDRLDADTVVDPLGDCDLRDRGRGRPAFKTRSGTKSLEIREHEEVRLVAGSDGPQMVETVPERRIQGGDHEGVRRGNPECDSIPDERVHVPVVGNVLGLAVVRAEGDPARAELLTRGRRA